jgi:glycosyltransferase involved in cell wall biosynthesis
MNLIHNQNTSIVSNKNKWDILHLTSPLPIKMKNTPKIVTIHDIIPIVAPDTTPINISRYRKFIQNSISDADDILVVSNKSKNDLLNYFDVHEEKIHVTFQSVSIPNQYKNYDLLLLYEYLNTTLKIEYKKFFLFYGAIEPKKNVMRILEAYNQVKTDYPLIIVGKNGWMYDDVDNFFNNLNPSNRKFVRIKHLPFRNLMMLLKSSAGLIFPSIYEGFGLPVLEAMEMGVPVITSNTSSLPEVGGDAVCYVNPFDVVDIAKSIDKFINNQTYCDDLVTKGYEQIKKFTPEEHYSKIMNVYQKYS